MHHHDHDHPHDHHHDHHDIRPLRIAMAITTSILVLQIVGGVVSGSLALLSDAGHVFVDLGPLLIAYTGLHLAARARERHDARYTFGLRRIEILAALTNGFLLVGMCIFIAIEAVERFFDPHDVHAEAMLYVAIAGFIGNGISAWYLHRSDHITTQSAYLHVLTDLGSSAGVIVAAVLLELTGWQWIDPAISLAIALIILRGAGAVIYRAGVILMESAPQNMDPEKVRTGLGALDGVLDVHDVHIWELGHRDVKASVHVVTDQPTDDMVRNVQAYLREHCSINHATVQVESPLLASDCGTCDPLPNTEHEEHP